MVRNAQVDGRSSRDDDCKIAMTCIVCSGEIVRREFLLRFPRRRADTVAMPAHQHVTAAMVRRLNANTPTHWPRYETVSGELLVTPAPRWWHQEVVDRLAFALRAYLMVEPVGLQVRAPADVSWGLRDTMVQPDIFVVPLGEARTFDYRQIRHLLLAIEVLSPRTARADRGVKRALYQRQGVPLYWIVDADALSVEEWTPEATAPRIERDELVWHPAGAVAPCTIPLAALFRPV